MSIYALFGVGMPNWESWYGSDFTILGEIHSSLASRLHTAWRGDGSEEPRSLLVRVIILVPVQRGRISLHPTCYPGGPSKNDHDKFDD